MGKETNSANNNKTSASQAGVDKLNAVRNLLFGEIDEEYRSEFEDLKQSMESNFQQKEKEGEQQRKEILDRIDQLEQKIESKLDATVNDLNGKLEALTQGKVDRSQMSKILLELARSLEG
ncbi:MAG: hypothetical protein AAGA85_12965 [Bacteroidota bacterium]